MDLQSKILNSYLKRASIYEKRTDWVNLDICLKPLITKPFGNRRALDVCAGTGSVTNALVNAGWFVVSIDLSKSMLQQHVLPYPIIGDMHNLPFLDKYFDIVVCRQGLQYADIKKVISEFLRVCTNSIYLGHITTEEGDSYNFWKKYFKIASPGRKHVFSPGFIEGLIKSLNLSINTIEILKQQDNYWGPLLHLPYTKQLKLYNLLINMPDDFKKKYNFIIKNNLITYSNRWEFLKIDV